jgi:predicted nucleotidyltransferase
MPGVKREDLAPAQDLDEGRRIAEEAARRLANAYGDRLQRVVLFGSWARGQAHEESDVDLVVVLDHVGDRASERDRIVDALFDLEADSRRLKRSQWPRLRSRSGVGPLYAPRWTRVYSSFETGRDEHRPEPRGARRGPQPCR